MAIVKRSQYRRKRSYRKRPSGFRKTVAKIATKAVMRQSETKIAVNNWQLNFGGNGLLLTTGGANGLFNGIVQGTSSSTRIGDKIKVTNVKFRLHTYVDPVVMTAGREFAAVRVIMCTNKQDQLTSSDFPTYTSTQDPEKVTVLYDKYLNMSSTNWKQMITRNLWFNRVAKYVGTQCIGKNLYFYIVPSPLGTGLTTSQGYSISGSTEIYYKDL